MREREVLVRSLPSEGPLAEDVDEVIATVTRKMRRLGADSNAPLRAAKQTPTRMCASVTAAELTSTRTCAPLRCRAALGADPDAPLRVILRSRTDIGAHLRADPTRPYPTRNDSTLTDSRAPMRCRTRQKRQNFLRPYGRIFGIIVAFRGGNPQGSCSLTYSRAQNGPGSAARKRGVRQGRVATPVAYAILRIWLQSKTAKFSCVKPSM